MRSPTGVPSWPGRQAGRQAEPGELLRDCRLTDFESIPLAKFRSPLLDLIPPVYRNTRRTTIVKQKFEVAVIASSRMNISFGGKEISLFFFFSPSSELSLDLGWQGKINYSSRIGREKVVIIRGKYKLNTRGEVYQPPLPLPLVTSVPFGASPPHRLVLGSTSRSLRPSFLPRE